MSTLLGSECVAQDPGGLVILGSETTCLLWSHFRFKWVCWFKTLIFGLIMAFHTGPFNKCHSFWTYETHRFSAPSGKYEQKWVCPFRIKCSISAVHFSFFGERHLFLTVLYLSPSHSWFSTLSSVCTAESQCLPQYNHIRQTWVWLTAPSLSVVWIPPAQKHDELVVTVEIWTCFLSTTDIYNLVHIQRSTLESGVDRWAPDVKQSLMITVF